MGRACCLQQPHPIDAENMCKHSALDRIFSPQRQHLTGECDMLVR
jgi:hypothetical protein